MSMRVGASRDRDNDDVHPLKGPKGDTTFLQSNYKTMSVGSSFRTVKARFSPRQIHAGAEKAGFVVRLTEEGPWLKVTITKKLPPKPPAPKKTNRLLWRREGVSCRQLYRHTRHLFLKKTVDNISVLL